MSKTVCILDRPKLNLLGGREPETCSRETPADVQAECGKAGGPLGLTVHLHPSIDSSRARGAIAGRGRQDFVLALHRVAPVVWSAA